TEHEQRMEQRVEKLENLLQSKLDAFLADVTEKIVKNDVALKEKLCKQFDEHWKKLEDNFGRHIAELVQHNQDHSSKLLAQGCKVMEMLSSKGQTFADKPGTIDKTNASGVQMLDIVASNTTEAEAAGNIQSKLRTLESMPQTGTATGVEEEDQRLASVDGDEDISLPHTPQDIQDNALGPDLQKRPLHNLANAPLPKRLRLDTGK
ncbi:hypothetical protein EG329_001954, partial [Mollisiaceae sp. DMI_Dod_QoI]